MKRNRVVRKCIKCGIESLVRKDKDNKMCIKCFLYRDKVKDITGFKSGRLTVVSESHRHKGYQFWHCECECGNRLIVNGYSLRSKNTKSCGCIRAHKNGLSKTGAYISWKEMIKRCYNIKSTGYDKYGAKGITVCDRWRNSFEYFLQDMGARDKGWSIDRINFFGNYEPVNCRWSTVKEQNSNKSSNRIINAFGQDQTLSEWSDITGIKVSTLKSRIDNYDWAIERALTEKVREIKKGGGTVPPPP